MTKFWGSDASWNKELFDCSKIKLLVNLLNLDLKWTSTLQTSIIEIVNQLESLKDRYQSLEQSNKTGYDDFSATMFCLYQLDTIQHLVCYRFSLSI